jgi:hypothetical protein
MACIKIYGANKAVTYIPRVTGNTMLLLFGFFSVEWEEKSFLQFNKLNLSSSDFKPVQYNNDACFSLKSRWFMLSRDQSVILILVAKLKF